MRKVDVLRTLCVLVIAIGFVFSSSAAAQQGEPKKSAARPIDPPDLYALTMLVRKELELIRLEMGKPGGRPSALKVKNAAPREVLFQALTLFRKTKRLCFEQLREHIEMPDIHRGKIRPAQVYAVVDKVLTNLQNLKAGLSITEKSEKPPRDASKTPTDVFRSIGEGVPVIMTNRGEFFRCYIRSNCLVRLVPCVFMNLFALSDPAMTAYSTCAHA